ncbi:hypothetical protein [Dietzia sp. ANT_WB102]|uniref:hypothetical protein n=1 Tax=Dietzia sp. ANT_WB102 TaxID=2597345 RepID=UPI0011EC8CE8|nr:hypothetical protein [Dietzia sp. ANT_WB102]KAA0919368.1 hypothetical protein FQ137_09020 [Dietzia sp. ANT_WB102]
MNRLTKHWLTKRVSAAAVTALIVFAAVAAALLLRPDAYDARIGLLAVPRTTPAAAERADFGVVVANSLPAVIEVAHSVSTVTAAASRVPGAPADPSTIIENVTVDIIPASGLARLTVRGEDPDVAAGLATELAAELVQANLLSPTAALRVLDPVPTVKHASPDLLLAAGLAAAAGVTAGAAALGAATLWWPRPERRLRRLLEEAGIGHAVVVIHDDGSTDGLGTLRLLRETVGRPLRLVASEPQLVDAAARLSDTLSLESAPINDDRRVAVGLVTHSAAPPEPLRATVGSLPDPHEIVAVILSDDGTRDEADGGPRTGSERNLNSDAGPVANRQAESTRRASTELTGVGRHASRTDAAGRPVNGSSRREDLTLGEPPGDDPVTGEAASASAR